MRLKHQLRDQNVEREVNDSIPLGFFMSNKIGGMLYFDANKDKMQYYARVNGRTFKIMHDVNIEGSLVCVNNKFHSLELLRDEHGHEVFVPYYMNALTITSNSKSPVQMVLHPKDMEKGELANNSSVSAKEGRIIVKSILPGVASDNTIYTVVQGDNLTYESSIEKVSGQVTLELISPRVTIAVGNDEREVVKAADHIYQNEAKLKDIQENYISSFTSFKDPEAAMAYACVLNGTDHMFLPDQDASSNAMKPVPFFSEVTSPHTAIATHALLSEGEFGIVKKTLFRELEIQKQRMEQGQSSFEEAAWTMFLFGKMLNQLCTHNRLYNYFSPEDIKSSAQKIIALIDIMAEKYSQEDGTLNTEYGNPLESQALMLSIYNFVYALTKIEKYQKAEQDLREPVRKALFEKNGPSGRGEPAKRQDVHSLLLTAYTYPILLSNEEWKTCFDNILESLHQNFQTLQSKMIQEEEEGALKLEHFGLTSLAAIVLYKTDPEHYESQINNLVRESVTDVLFKGVIGRPTSAFKFETDPEITTMINDAHLLNNALFLEMIRECV